jgi:hypothetical protein
MAVELRPLSLGELLDSSFTYYRERFWTFVGIMAPTEALAIVCTLALQAVRSGSGITATSGPGGARLLPVQAFSWLGAILIVWLISALAHAVALAASSTAMSKVHLGEPVTIAGAYRSLRESIGPLAALLLLFVLIVLGAYMILMLSVAIAVAVSGALIQAARLPRGTAGLVVAVSMLVGMVGGSVLALRWCLRYTLAVPALVLERLRPGQALGRSSRLAKGDLGRIFLALGLMYLIALVVSLVFELPFWVTGSLMGYKFSGYPFWLTAPLTLAGGVGATVGYPVVMIALPLLYYDARVRKEGFDLQVMISSLDASPTGGGVVAEVVADASERLQKIRVAWMILLTIVTAGLYVPGWFLARRTALNRLNSPEKLGPALPTLALFLDAIGLVLGFALRNAGALAANAPLLVLAVYLAAGVTLLLLAFKVRRILEDHLNARRASGALFVRPEPLSGVATFFFGAFYLQHKVNELLDDINAAAGAVVSGEGDSLAPGVAMAPPSV